MSNIYWIFRCRYPSLSLPLFFFLDFRDWDRLLGVFEFISESSSLLILRISSPGGILDFALLLARRPFPQFLASGLRPLGMAGWVEGPTSAVSRGNAFTISSFTRYLLNRNVGVTPFVWRVYQNVRIEWQWSSFMVDGSPSRDSRSDGR